MTSFSDLGLSPSTVKAVTDTGYTTPTPIQEQAIPVALAGRDVLGIAQTGTGKTAAFTLPMIDRLSAGRAKARMPRSLVIAPTRELADQVAASFDKYAKGTKLTWALLIGGVSFADQEMKLDRGVDVLIATPGRLLDHFERGRLLMTGVQTMVVDEADRMLDMGFIPDLERIFNLTPKAKQTLFFSATMPPEITRLTAQFLKDPTRIEVSRPASTGENIRQFVARIPLDAPKAKRMALRVLVERANPDSGIIFCNRKSEVDIVAKSLKLHGFDAAPIHGDLDQSMRTKTLESFRKGQLKLLVASDVAARGLDIPAVSHVFNYDVPHQADDYVHRIGRTGRAGRSGETYMIVGPNDGRNYDKVVRLTHKEPEEVTVEVDWEEAARGAERDKERFGSRRSQGPREGGRDRDRDRARPVADHGQRASFEPIVNTPAAVSAVTDGEVSASASSSRLDLDPTPAPVPSDEAVVVAPSPRRRRERGRAARDGGARDGGARGGEGVSPAPTALQPLDSGDETPVEAPPRRARAEPAVVSRAEPSEPRPARGAPSSGRASRPPIDREPPDENGVRGFGADTPAFLLRAAPLAPVARKPAPVPVSED